jgi:hypothetical protein
VVEDYQYFKRQENESLKQYASDNNLWLKNINLENFVSEGALPNTVKYGIQESLEQADKGVLIAHETQELKYKKYLK